VKTALVRTTALAMLLAHLNPAIYAQPRSGKPNFIFILRARNDGWGFFTQVSLSNKSTSPITFLDAGFGGNGPFKGRPTDEFVIAYAYTDLSKVLKGDLQLIGFRRQRVEHQVETFYNLHITNLHNNPLLRLTLICKSFARPGRPPRSFRERVWS
jgi:hypothetical protein